MLIDLLPKYWAMKPEALRAAMADASAVRSYADMARLDSSGSGRKPYSVSNGLAVIPIQGSLLKEFHYPPFWTSYVVVRAMLETALADPEVRAIFLDIDSPGGTVAGFQDLAEAIYAARLRKPVFSWTDGMACSAAYGLGAAADLFAASPMAEVGSVGVMCVHTEWTKWDEKQGLTVTVFRAGEFKALGNEYEGLDAKASQVIQESLDGMYEIFRESVASYRGLSLEKYEEWAEGRVFLAKDAVAVGLLDLACSRDEYLSRIQKEVNMDANELRAKFPDVVMDIENEAAKAAAAKHSEELATAKTTVVELAGTILGPEAKDKLAAAVEAGLTADQAAKLGLNGPAAGSDEAARMLAAILETDKPGVKPGASSPAKGNPLMAAVTRMFGKKE